MVSMESVGQSVCIHTESIYEFKLFYIMNSIIVKCRPFYLPREFSVVFVVAVYVAPSANVNSKANEALGALHDAISEFQTKYPDSFIVVAGDFNHTSLKTVLPKFKQYVDFETRGENTLDLVYTNTPEAYKAAPPPSPGPLTTFQHF